MKENELIHQAKLKIASVRGRTLTVEKRIEEAIELASLMIQAANAIETRAEKLRFAELSRMVNDAKGKAFVINITDQCFRSQQARRIYNQLNHILQQMGIPHFLNGSKRFGLRLFQKFAGWAPGLFVPIMKGMLRYETTSLILPGEQRALSRHMEARRREGVRINLNHLGEAILGEEEALHRLQIYLDDLANPQVEYISVKISTIYSQINLLANDKNIMVLSDRLRTLLRAASEHTFKRSDQSVVSKFVNLDMEEYRDLRLTVDVFKKVLDEAEFKYHSAGIVLQSYVPDSFLIQQELTAWAMQRLLNGGAPIKIRLVKGANLAMEQVEASLKGWPQAPYCKKSDVDANFKKMVTYGMKKEHATAVSLGIASHNLFDIAYAYILCAENNVDDDVCFEMLEGMADPLRRVVQQLTGDILLYCPAATSDEFQHALAYLVRRLDENTAPENFLRHIFGLTPDSPDWQKQANLFTTAAQYARQVNNAARRTQNRSLPSVQSDLSACFENEPDTDWALEANQKWAHAIIDAWMYKRIELIPVVVGGETVTSTKKREKGIDPSRPENALYEFCLADEMHAAICLSTAKNAEIAWQQMPTEARSQLLADIAQALRVHRADLIGCMMLGTGKTIPESDVEVSEAIDFADYYRRNSEELRRLKDIHWQAKGTVLVAPPWNFPCSIPLGGILAALATGNCVIFKPAPEAVLVGWQIVQILWQAGVSKDVLQFIPCADDPVGSILIKDPRINAVVLTGATETAKLFMKMRPSLDLIAETGGKNAIIVTAASDRDLAIKDIIQSAFGHAGQKCSACSLLILEAEVYDDPHFKEQLRDATASLAVGSAWDPVTKVNPLIRPPGQILQRGLSELEEGEEWLLKPVMQGKSQYLWSPGIKWAVQPGSFMHQTELFGPVLGVIRADNLTHAIHIANGTKYGLTSGLQSLDEREKVLWQDSIEAGNCYINRGVTGAIVQRQPFGGCKDSSFGSGAKAGGPNYLMQLMHAKQMDLPIEKEPLSQDLLRIMELAKKDLSESDYKILQASVGNYVFYWIHYFSKDHDPSLLIGQDNLLRYKAIKKLCVRIQSGDVHLDFWKIVSVAEILHLQMEVSFDSSFQAPWEKVDEILSFVTWTAEEEGDWIKRCISGTFAKVRLLSNPSDAIVNTLAEAGIHFYIGSAYANGRLELLKFLREVVISNDYHRYGNLGLREGEKRKPLIQPSKLSNIN